MPLLEEHSEEHQGAMAVGHRLGQAQVARRQPGKQIQVTEPHTVAVAVFLLGREAVEVEPLTEARHRTEVLQAMAEAHHTVAALHTEE